MRISTVWAYSVAFDGMMIVFGNNSLFKVCLMVGMIFEFSKLLLNILYMYMLYDIGIL